MFATIEDLRAHLGTGKTPAQRQAYAAKMLHPVPAAEVVDREGLLVDLCRGKRVLEFGASGPLTSRIRAVASGYLGVDRQDGDGVVGFDLDAVTRADLPVFEADVIVCGELLEHLSNPGHFLDRLSRQYRGVPVALSVPNAFSAAAASHIVKGVENVNPDHVAWFSYKTLTTLLGRHGYRLASFCWYGGRPGTAEGIVGLAETT